MKTSYVERAKHFIDEIATAIPENPKKSDVEQVIANYCAAHPRRKVFCRSGAARTAIITSDYVVKIDTGDTDVFGGCEDEMRFYEKAKEKGMDYLLAEVSRYKHNFYIYPRAKVLSETKKELDSWISKFSYREALYINDKFDDIHKGNVGYLAGKPVIIDYAMGEKA